MSVKLWKLAAAASLALAATATTFAENPSSAVAQDEWRIKGLSAPAELIIDHWGIPHIFAASQRDAFFLQGYNAARDRLWQIDLWRKRGLGLLSKSLGPAYVEQDRAARLPDVQLPGPGGRSDGSEAERGPERQNVSSADEVGH